MLARDVAKKIESEMTYPGQIRVTVIRETRATEVAHVASLRQGCARQIGGAPRPSKLCPWSSGEFC